MRFEKDDAMAEAYAQFGRDHEVLRAELLSRVRQSDNSQIRDEAVAANPARLAVWRGLIATVVAVAAMVLMFVGTMRLLAPADPAGRTSILSSQIEIVKSVCIPGWYTAPEPGNAMN